MLWREIRPFAMRGRRRIRREIHRDRYYTYDVAHWLLTSVNPVTLVEGPRRVVCASDFTREDYLAADWTLDPIPALPGQLPLATITLPDAFSATPVSFGTFDPGTYRVVYERGAIYYGATKNQLRVNAYSTSGNGYKIRTGDGSLVNAPGFNSDPSDPFRYAADDPRTERELLEDIEARESGRFVEFTHPGGVIEMFLSDAPYTDNAATAQMPAFSLYLAG